MKTLELKDGFYWAGIVDDSLRVFDIIMYTEFGTTYNSYVWKTGDKTILFETAKGKCFDEYLDKLKEIIDVTKIDYLVVSHTEPDHAGSIEDASRVQPADEGDCYRLCHRIFKGNCQSGLLCHCSEG